MSGHVYNSRGSVEILHFSIFLMASQRNCIAEIMGRSVVITSAFQLDVKMEQTPSKMAIIGNPIRNTMQGFKPSYLFFLGVFPQNFTNSYQHVKLNFGPCTHGKLSGFFVFSGTKCCQQPSKSDLPSC